MTDEERLFDATSDPLERALLEEARSGGASERARTQTLAALGLSTKVTPAGGGSSLGLKVGAGVASIGIAVAIAYGVSGGHRAAPSSSSSSPVVVVAAPASAHEATPKEATSAVEPAVVVTAPPSASALAAWKPPVASARTAPKPPENDGLSEEVRLIDAARQALYDHDKEATLRALAEYDRRFPKGRMAPEAERLRQRARDLR